MGVMLKHNLRLRLRLFCGFAPSWSILVAEERGDLDYAALRRSEGFPNSFSIIALVE
jgi:hypothetical protein